jgi:hypothetical protein
VWEGYDGGVSQFKYHLAQIPRHDIGICPNTIPKIIVKAKNALEGYGKKKEHKESSRRFRDKKLDREGLQHSRQPHPL